LVRLEYRILISCLADEVARPIVVGRLIAEALDTAEMVSTLKMVKAIEAVVAAEAEVGEIEEEEDHPRPTEDLQHRRITEADVVEAIVVAVASAETGEVWEGQDRLCPHDLTLTMSTLSTSEPSSILIWTASHAKDAMATTTLLEHVKDPSHGFHLLPGKSFRTSDYLTKQMRMLTHAGVQGGAERTLARCTL
jgi:hypothetical protein